MTARTADSGGVRAARPSRPVLAAALVTAACCVGFAAVNVSFEATGFIANGRDADYAAGFTVLNWLVVGLKLVGAAAVIWAAFGRPRGVRRSLLGLTLWGGFATLAIYTLGSLGQAIAMLLGHFGGPDLIDAGAVAYVLFFALITTGFGIVAISHHRRCALRAWVPVLGVVVGPLVLVFVLVAVPTLLVALDIMPPA